MKEKNSKSIESSDNEQENSSKVSEAKHKNPPCRSHPSSEVLFYC